MKFSQQTIQQMIDEYLEIDDCEAKSRAFFIYNFSESHNIYAQGCRLENGEYEVEMTGEDYLLSPESLGETGTAYLESLGWEEGPAGNFVCILNRTKL